ncbi:hypothetical protein RQP46_010895 [Phenoliferia psychrophenolica]
MLTVAIGPTQEHWSTHRSTCNPDPPTPISAAILDIGHDLMPFHFPLRDAIRARASSCLYLDTLPAALAALASSTPPSAVWITNEELAKRPALVSALLAYVERGGTIVLGGSLQSCINPSNLDALFRDLKLSWKMGPYHRTTHAVIPTHPVLPTLTGGVSLPSSYSMKAVMLKDVPEDEVLYRPADGARHESLAMQLSPGGGGKVDAKEVPIAMGQVGEGWIAWIGDVNAEAGTTQVVLTLMGLGEA